MPLGAEAERRLDRGRDGFRSPKIGPRGDDVGHELGAEVAADGGGSDGLKEGRLAEAVLPDEHGPHPRVSGRVGEAHLRVPEELDVLHV